MSDKSELEPESGAPASETLAQSCSKPSKIIKFCQKTICIDDKTYDLTLVTMRRSFLLVVRGQENFRPGLPPIINDNGKESDISADDLIQSFMNNNPALNGLSLAIGDHSTCLIPSENSITSSTIAIRLSKKYNLNRPVYVASDIQTSSDIFDATELVSKLYLKIFQFVGSNYHPESDDGSSISSSHN